MSVGTETTFANGNATDLRDLRCNFTARQHATTTWLGALTDFDFDRFDVVAFTLCDESFFIKGAICCPSSVVAGSQLPNEI